MKITNLAAISVLAFVSACASMTGKSEEAARVPADLSSSSPSPILMGLPMPSTHALCSGTIKLKGNDINIDVKTRWFKGHGGHIDVALSRGSNQTTRGDDVKSSVNNSLVSLETKDKEISLEIDMNQSIGSKIPEGALGMVAPANVFKGVLNADLGFMYAKNANVICRLTSSSF